MNDCPSLESIMERERRLIKLRQQIRDEKANMVKTKSGKLVRKPYLPPKPINGEGCSIQNGIPCKPELDWSVKKHAKKRKRL